MTILMVIAKTAVPTLGIFVPKLIIEAVMGGAEIGAIVYLIVILSAAMMALKILEQTSERYIVTKQMALGAEYITDIDRKALTTDYENIAGDNGQTALTKAYNTTGNDNAPTRAMLIHIINLSKNALGLIINSTILIFLNPVIIALLAASSVVSVFIGRWSNSFANRYKTEESVIDKQFSYLKENAYDLRASKDIKIYGMAGLLLEKFSYNISNKKQVVLKKTKGQERAAVINGVLAFVRDGAAYAYLIYLAINGLNMADFVLYIGAIAAFSDWFGGLAQDLVKINQASLGYCDFREFIETKDNTNSLPGRPLPGKDGQPCSVQIKNLTYSYGGKPLFDDFSLNIEKGAKVAVVGLNGAGKTTLMKLLMGLYRPQSGEILVDGAAIDEYNIGEYYSLFSVAFQDAVVMAFTLRENVAMKQPELIDDIALSTALEKAGLSEKVQSLPLKERSYLYKNLDKDGIDLSGGEKQKLFLARAIYKDAPFFILDEPTAALDAIAEAELYEKYNDLTAGKTSIYISHRLASTQFCDEIIYLENGKIAERGSHGELLALGGKYAHMYETQSFYYKEQP